jgi:hypothetical protein
LQRYVTASHRFIINLLVGAAGFEPTTSRTPSECATGLRYAPTLLVR